MYHKPVMVTEVVDYLNIQPDGVYVDCTFGGGGHSLAILDKLENGSLLGFDQDKDARMNILNDKRFIFVEQNFKYLKNYLQYYKLFPVDGILADLGVSSYQIDTPERGFSYLQGENRLDMRMNKTSVKSAVEIINSYDEKQLSDMFWQYGEVVFARKLSREIIVARRTEKIIYVSQLADIVKTIVPEYRLYSNLSRVFQALRIEVNEELVSLKELLSMSLEVLKPGARIEIITYHSLEDRIVKNFFRFGNHDGILHKDFYGKPLNELNVITKKPLIPGKDEIELNPRARSAKLRVAEKK